MQSWLFRVRHFPVKRIYQQGIKPQIDEVTFTVLPNFFDADISFSGSELYAPILLAIKFFDQLFALLGNIDFVLIAKGGYWTQEWPAGKLFVYQLFSDPREISKCNGTGVTLIPS